MKTTALLTFGLFALLCATVARADDTQRTLSATIAAGNVHKVALSTGAGAVRIEPSTDGAVHVTVRIEPKETGFWFVEWTDGDAATDMAKARLKLDKTVHDGVLDISLTMPGDDDDDQRFKEKWTIRMPPALALKADVKVGEVRIDGIAGGVDAETGVGEMRIRVPRGSVRAHVRVGELDVTTAASDYKTLTLDSSIGDVEIHGLNLSDEARGRSLGKHVSLQGHGTDEFDLSSNIGKVDLTFGAQP